MMDWTHTAAILAVALFSLPAAAAKTELQHEIDGLVSPFAEAGHFSGIVVAARDGEVIYESAFGSANAEHGVPNRVDTRVGVASVTKSMTVVILARLIEQGRISPDDKVSRYLPRFPRGDDITVEILARHRSGIPHRVMPVQMESVSHTSAEMVEKISEAGLEFEPGSSRLYSSAGYTLLTRVLEIASGTPYEDLLEKYVFGPAAMQDSLDFDSRKVIDRQADEYFLAPTGYTKAALKDYSFLVGAGSVVSTAPDIYRFARAVVTGTYGDLAKTHLTEGEVFRSNGSTNGYRAFVKVDGGERYGYVVVSNLASGANDVIIDGLDEIMKGQPPREVKVLNPKIISVPKFGMADYFGNYRREGSTSGGFEVTMQGSQLFAGDIGSLSDRPGLLHRVQVLR